MKRNRTTAGILGLAGAMVGAVLLPIVLGGCPVAQVPRDSTASSSNDNANASDDDGVAATNSNVNGGSVRPIPSVAIIDEEVDGPINTDLPDLDDSIAAPLSVVIASLEQTLNTLPGTTHTIAYEVFGGGTQDGPISVRLYHDLDGVAESGDEVFFAQGLPSRALIDFDTTGLPAGRYFVGVEARNNASVIVRYAIGQLELVGAATFTFSRPFENTRVRPTGQIDVRGDILTLARNVGWRIFTDTDRLFNGNEVTAFAGGGTRVNGAIFPIDLPRGSYFIGIEIIDSLTQRFVQYLAPAGADCVNDGTCRTFTIDQPPSLQVSSPDLQILAQPGEIVTVRATASDVESAATVTLFRDADSAVNGNEFILQTFVLAGAEQEFTVDFDSTGLFPSTYRFGAIVDDGVGAPVSAYAPGSLVILEAPSADAFFAFQAEYARRANESEPLDVRFLVRDPMRRLSLQPLGIRLNLYKDENSDGVRDDDTPILSTTNDFENRPFRADRISTVQIDLTDFGLNAGADGLADILGEVVLNERIGNVTRFPGAFVVARLDLLPPTGQIVSPPAFDPIPDSAQLVELTVGVRINDNAPFARARLRLVGVVDFGEVPISFSVTPFFTVATNANISLDAEVGFVPIGTYNLVLEFGDGTGVFQQRIGPVVTVVP